MGERAGEPSLLEILRAYIEESRMDRKKWDLRWGRFEEWAEAAESQAPLRGRRMESGHLQRPSVGVGDPVALRARHETGLILPET